jgi:hypothetical protein
MSTEPKQKQPRARLTDAQKRLHAQLRKWSENPTSEAHLHRLIDSLLDYELAARLKALREHPL